MHKVTLKKRVASSLWPMYSDKIDRLQWNTKFNGWFHDHRNLPTFAHRFDLYRYIHAEFVKEEPIDYLEFGVFQGQSMAEWLRINSHSASRFVGFDSFEGLPEDWEAMKKGSFDVKGVLPNLNDPRLRFMKGWFQDSLPVFLKDYTPQARVIVNNDSDLYSSTLYTLAKLDSALIPGSILIFDEINSTRHEFRAMIDYTAAFWRKAKPVALMNDGYIIAAAFLFE